MPGPTQHGATQEPEGWGRLDSELAMGINRRLLNGTESESSQESRQDRRHFDRVAVCHLYHRNPGIDALACGDARVLAGQGVR
jgi:hypothetical protein